MATNRPCRWCNTGRRRSVSYQRPPVEVGLPLDRREERDVYGDFGQAATPRTLVDLPVGGQGLFSGC
jgi:hypothetical protein